MNIVMKQNKLRHFSITSQVQYSVQSSTQCQNSQTIVVISTVTAQSSLLNCFSPLPLTAQNGLVFIQRPLILKYNKLTDKF